MKQRKKKIQNNGGNRLTHYGFGNSNQKGQTKQDNTQTKNKQDKGKNKKQKNGDYHDSSMEAEGENSHTVVLSSQENQQFMEFQRPVQVCHQQILIAPHDVTYFYGIKKRIKELINAYSKQQTIKLILQNVKYQSISNLNILNSIDDSQFWGHTMPKLLQLAADEKKQKSISCLQMLIPASNQVKTFQKSQIFMVLINMFLGILPKQSHVKTPLNFAKLMTFSQHEAEMDRSRKLEKLKCIINYLKQVSKRTYKQLQKEDIQIQRVSNSMGPKQYRQIQYQMKEVQILIGLVQDRDKYEIVVDFANKKIGGGVLNKGAVQQQILFAIYPQLFMTMCICYEMSDNQAILVYNAQRFSSYSGYSDTFKYQGPYEIDEDKRGPFQSIILAVDAVNFTEEPERQYAQYRGQLVQRQLIKFLTGVETAQYKADQTMGVCTGKWGCGVFAGDFYLKFLIQWIACSVANRNMVFMCSDEKQKNQLQAMYNFLKRFNTAQILQIIQQFNQYFQPSKSTQITFIQYLKKYSS